MVGQSLNVETAAATAEIALAGATPLSNNGYKVQIARTAVERALLRAAVRGKEGCDGERTSPNYRSGTAAGFSAPRACTFMPTSRGMKSRSATAISGADAITAFMVRMSSSSATKRVVTRPAAATRPFDAVFVRRIAFRDTEPRTGREPRFGDDAVALCRGSAHATGRSRPLSGHDRPSIKRAGPRLSHPVRRRGNEADWIRDPHSLLEQRAWRDDFVRG